MAARHTLFVKIADCELSAEGAAHVVDSQYQRFMTVVENRASTRNVPRINVEGVLTRDANGPVRLVRLPETDDRVADALVLLIYGIIALAGEDPAPSRSVKKSATASGLPPTVRVDRRLRARMSLVERIGKKSGGKYTLNEDGMVHVEKLVAALT